MFYYVARSGANIVMREATTFILIGDIYSERYNAIYATYMGYDEIAHHSGIRDNDSFDALKKTEIWIDSGGSCKKTSARKHNDSQYTLLK